MQISAAGKEWGSVVKLGQQLEAQFPFNVRVVDQVAAARAQSGDNAGAVAEFRPLIEHYPNSVPLYERYAGYQLAAGDKAGARGSLEKAVALAPGDQRYQGNLVRFDLDQKGVDAALATAKSFAAASPSGAALLQSEVLARAKRLPEAIDILSRASAETPGSSITVELAAMTWASGRHDDGRAILQAWLKAHGDDGAARIKLGDFLMAEHDYDAAQADYEQSRAQGQRDPVLLNNLAWLYARKHDPRAAALARQAFRLAPSPQTADTLGWSLYVGGDAKTALRFLKDASTAQPKDVTIQYHLAAAMSATGDKVGARSLLQSALAGDAPFDDRDDAKALLDRL
jgi:Flp pilus assembly protein TadD